MGSPYSDWLSVNRKPTFILLFPALLIAILGCVLIITGCHRSVKHDSRLVKIAGAISENPELALDSLKSINRDGLSEADRYFHEFLTIKASDKAYIEHTSDKPVLDVIGYMEKHPEEDLYGEALYYGGRVYSDLGDYPQALDYFYRSIDILKEQPDQLSLLGTVQSQTGRLLNTLRLYKQAIPFLEASTENARQLKDTVNEIHDLQLLGSIHMRAKNYLESETCLLMAREISRHSDISQFAKSCLYLSELKLELGQIDSAYMYFRNTPDLVRPQVRNKALAIGILIYHAKGIEDSAYVYAKELINSKISNNKKTGYQYLLSEHSPHPLTKDSINYYSAEYLNLLEGYYDEHSNLLAVNQQASYNYNLRENRLKIVSSENITLLKTLIANNFLIIMLIGVIIMLYIQNKNIRKSLKSCFIKFNSFIWENTIWPNAKEDENSVSSTPNLFQWRPVLEKGEVAEDGALDKDNIPEAQISFEEARNSFQRECLEKSQQGNPNTGVSDVILKSEIYRQIQRHIEQKSALPYDSPLWEELEKVVILSSPQFKDNLRLLSGGKLTTADWETCLLMKCGLSSAHLIILLAKAKGTIVSRRTALSIKMFGVKMNYDQLLNIILYL
jgi:tetratricopeptide (TPR) repeat protein